MAKKHMGVCLLTGQRGAFVKSHILPAALTRPEVPGRPWVQGGQGLRPVRRYSSWYDPRLVISEGEKILRDLDTWAIPVLRQHQLVWSGWGGATELPDPGIHIVEESSGFRHVTFADPLRLRLFFLSLLWRAAASDIPEMVQIQVPTDHLERLAMMVRSADPYPLGFYPMMLYQLSSRGPSHNLTPIAQVIMEPGYDGSPARSISTFRIYMDGLSIRFYRQDLADDKCLSGMHVGFTDRTYVGTVPYEESFQYKNLSLLQMETKRLHGDVLDRLLRPPRGPR